MPQVVGDESRNEVVAVVVARVASQHQRTARFAQRLRRADW